MTQSLTQSKSLTVVRIVGAIFAVAGLFLAGLGVRSAMQPPTPSTFTGIAFAFGACMMAIGISAEFATIHPLAVNGEEQDYSGQAAADQVRQRLRQPAFTAVRGTGKATSANVDIAIGTIYPALILAGFGVISLVADAWLWFHARLTPAGAGILLFSAFFCVSAARSARPQRPRV